MDEKLDFVDDKTEEAAEEKTDKKDFSRLQVVMIFTKTLIMLSSMPDDKKALVINSAAAYLLNNPLPETDDVLCKMMVNEICESIDEAEEKRLKKSEGGKKGMNNRYSGNGSKKKKPSKSKKDDKNEKDVSDSSEDNIVEQIVGMYNDICVSLPKVQSISGKRKDAIKARLRTNYTYQDFETCFYKAENSNFLKGANKRNWTANFDWLICDSNMAKVIDGNYDNNRFSNVTMQEYNAQRNMTTHEKQMMQLEIWRREEEEKERNAGNE